MTVAGPLRGKPSSCRVDPEESAPSAALVFPARAGAGGDTCAGKETGSAPGAFRAASLGSTVVWTVLKARHSWAWGQVHTQSGICLPVASSWQSVGRWNQMLSEHRHQLRFPFVFSKYLGHCRSCQRRFLLGCKTGNFLFFDTWLLVRGHSKSPVETGPGIKMSNSH